MTEISPQAWRRTVKILRWSGLIVYVAVPPILVTVVGHQDQPSNDFIGVMVILTLIGSIFLLLALGIELTITRVKKGSHAGQENTGQEG